MDQRVNGYTDNGVMGRRDVRGFIAGGFFGSSVMEDGEFLKLLEEFDKIDEKKLNNILNDEKFGKLKQMSASDIVKLFRKGSK